MARTTRHDVAGLAGVAPSTVSHVLNGHAARMRISADTAARVEAAARELRYVPSASARSLRGRASHTLGLLLAPLPPSPFVPVVHDVLTAAMLRTQERGYLVLPVPQPADALDLAHVHRMVADVDLGGVVCEMSDLNVEAGEKLQAMGLAVTWMSLGRPEEFPAGIGHVGIDERPGVRDVLARLRISETATIGVLLGPRYRPERVDVVTRMFPGRVVDIRARSWAPADGYTATMGALAGDSRIEAIFCASDLLAGGALHACATSGLAVPDQVSVIGFGGNALEGGSRSLTSVRWPLRELTTAAFDMLIDHLHGDLPPGAAAADQGPAARLLATHALPGATARLADTPLR